MSKILMISAIDAGKCNACTIHFFSIANAFSTLKHDIEIIIPRPKNNTIAVDVKKNIRIFKKITIGRFKLPNFIIGLLQIPSIAIHTLRGSFEIIYIRNYNGSFILTLLMRLVTKSRIITEHNGWIADELLSMKHPSWIAQIMKKSQILDAKFAHSVRVVTPQLGQLLIQHKIREKKIFCVGNGTNTSNIKPIPRNEALRQIKLSPKYFYLGFIGTIHAWQGLESTIKAFKLVKQKKNNIKLIIAGEGPQLSYIKKLSAENALSNDIIFLETISHEQINYVLNSFNIALAPFTHKRNMRIGLSPLKMRDYAAAGLPIIASDIPGIKNENENMDWISLFEPENHNDLSNTILTLFEKYDSLIKIRQSARQYAENYYDWHYIASDIMTQQNLLNSNS